MKKYFFYILCFTIPIYSSGDQPQSLKTLFTQAIKQNNGNTVTQLLQSNPHAIARGTIIYIIENNLTNALTALVQYVQNHPDQLKRCGFEENLELFEKTQTQTLLMHAASQSPDALKILLRLPSVRNTINFNYTFNLSAVTYFFSALNNALNATSESVEILLLNNATIPSNIVLSNPKHQLFAHASTNLQQKHEVHRYHFCLKQKRPEQTLSFDILKIIKSFVTKQRTYQEFHQNEETEWRRSYWEDTGLM